MFDLRPRAHGFEPHQHHCVVSLSKNINPSLVLVQPRKTHPFITKRLLMGCKESKQTNKQKAIEREFRYFIINSPAGRKDVLIICGGTEIARLEKTLPDNDPGGNLDDYQKVKKRKS